MGRRPPISIGPLPTQQVVAADEMGGAFADVRTNALKYASWKALPSVTYNDVNPVGDSVPWPAGGSNVAGAEARILAAPIVGETAGEFTVQKDSLVGEGTVRLRLPAGQWRLRLETGSNGTWSGTVLTADIDILNHPGMLFFLR